MNVMTLACGCVDETFKVRVQFDRKFHKLAGSCLHMVQAVCTRNAVQSKRLCCPGGPGSTQILNTMQLRVFTGRRPRGGHDPSSRGAIFAAKK